MTSVSRACGFVYWRDIKPGERIEETGNGFEVGDENEMWWSVYWHGQEAAEAQRWLKEHAVKEGA